MSRKIPIHASLSKKAAAAVLSGLLVFSGTPITPITQALADEPLEVENGSNPKANPTTTPQNDGELGVESASGNSTPQGTVGVQSVGGPDNGIGTQSSQDLSTQDDSNAIEVTDAASLNSAIASAQTGAVIKLKNNITYATDSKDPEVKAEGITLDLNGQTLDLSGNDNTLIVRNGSFTLKNGTVIKTAGKWFPIQLAGMNNVVYNVTVTPADVTPAIRTIDGSSVTIGASTLESTDASTIETGKASTVTINNQSKVISHYSDYTESMAPGSGKACSAVFMNQSVQLTVENSEIVGDVYGISGNGSKSQENGEPLYGDTVINIGSGATITSKTDAAIYQPQRGTLNVTGGTITGASAIQIRDGVLNLSGGSIKGTANPPATFPGNWSNGSVIDGAGISVASNTGYGDVQINYSGGTVESTSSTPVALYSWQNNENYGTSSEAFPTSVVFNITGDAAQAEATGGIVQSISKYAPQSFASASEENDKGVVSFAIGTVATVMDMIKNAASGSTIEVFDASSTGITLAAADINAGVNIKNAVEDTNAEQSDDESNIIRVVSTDDGSGSGNDNTINKGDETSAGAIKAITAAAEKSEIGLHDTTTVKAEASARYLIASLNDEQKKLTENDGTIAWTASPDIVTIDKDGKVTPKAAGKTTLTAKLSKDGEPVKDLDDKEVVATVELTILQAQLPKPEASDQVFDGSEKTPVVVKDGDKTLVAGTDYDITYKDNTNAGTATYKVTGKGNYTGTAEGSFKIAKATITDAKVYAVDDQVYTGKAISPKLTVKLGDLELTEGTDYTLTYKDNVRVGKATITVKGKGSIDGSVDVPFSITFRDVPTTHWAYDAVKEAAEIGLVSGYSGDRMGDFGPNDTIERAEVVSILWNKAGQPEPKKDAKIFSDVKAGAYYEKAVKWASSVGVVSGYENGNFGPADNATREQISALLANYARMVDGKEVTGSADDYAKMKDGKDVSDWAVSSVGWCFRSHIMDGSEDGRVNPSANATRAETTKMVLMLHKQ